MRNLDTSRRVNLHNPLTRDQVAAAIPAVTALCPHSSRSDRYAHVTTMDVVDAVMSKGLVPYSVSAALTRKEDRRGYQKHMLRFRLPGTTAFGTGAPEVVLVNSHDGTSSFQVYMGMIVFACANGLVVGSKWQSYNVRHSGADIVPKVIDAAYTVVEDFGKLAPRVADMQRITLSDSQAYTFAERAHTLRFGEISEDDKRLLPSPAALLRARRSVDANSSLWSVYNRVQENVIAGGVRSNHLVPQAGGWNKVRRSSTRPVGTIDSQIKLNRSLWDMAEELMIAA